MTKFPPQLFTGRFELPPLPPHPPRPRVLPQGVRAEIDWGAWERPPVYRWLDEHGVAEEEQRRVFNLGIGMCAVVPEADAGAGLVIGRLA